MVVLPIWFWVFLFLPSFMSIAQQEPSFLAFGKFMFQMQGEEKVDLCTLWVLGHFVVLCQLILGDFDDIVCDCGVRAFANSWFPCFSCAFKFYRINGVETATLQYNEVEICEVDEPVLVASRKYKLQMRGRDKFASRVRDKPF